MKKQKNRNITCIKCGILVLIGFHFKEVDTIQLLDECLVLSVLAVRCLKNNRNIMPHIYLTYEFGFLTH